MLELVDGRAEVFGTELIQHKKYVFPAGIEILSEINFIFVRKNYTLHKLIIYRLNLYKCSYF